MATLVAEFQKLQYLKIFNKRKIWHRYNDDEEQKKKDAGPSPSSSLRRRPTLDALSMPLRGVVGRCNLEKCRHQQPIKLPVDSCCRALPLLIPLPLLHSSCHI